VLIWRSRTAVAEPDAARFRGVPAFRSGIPVPAADLHALAAGRLDDKALDLLLRACLALNWNKARHQWDRKQPDVPVATLGLLHPLAAGLRQGKGRGEPADEPVTALSPEWAACLAAGQVTKVHRAAAARLRQAGWTAVSALPAHAGADGARIAAALVPRCLHPEAVLRLIAFETSPLSEEQS
jgi:CRISPR-associated protein Csx17